MPLLKETIRKPIIGRLLGKLEGLDRLSSFLLRPARHLHLGGRATGRPRCLMWTWWRSFCVYAIRLPAVQINIGKKQATDLTDEE